MARRTGTGDVRDIIEIVALLPWWAGVLLAILSYLLIHPYAIQPTPTGIAAGEAATTALVSALANVGQYVVPFLCLAGAGLSAVTRVKRRRLLSSATGSQSQQAIAAMDWREFEMLLAEGFRKRGFVVREQGGTGADGGVDLVLSKGGERFLVQCKHWRANAVGVEVVRELYGVMAATGAAGGYVVTSGQFTQPAREFAEGRNIELVGGANLLAILHAADAGAATPDDESEKALRRTHDTATPIGDPRCPTCGAAMVLRTAKRGNNAGSQFWGCSKYPACRGTRATD